MSCVKYLTGFALVAGVLATSSTAAAQEWRHYEPPQYQYSNQYPTGQYDRGNRYDRIEELQDHITRDRARLDEAIRCGRDADAARQAADLARDQRVLQYQMREVRPYPDDGYYRPYSRGWSFSWRWR